VKGGTFARAHVMLLGMSWGTLGTRGEHIGKKAKNPPPPKPKRTKLGSMIAC